MSNVARQRRRIQLAVTALVVAGALGLAFKLFEPYVTAPFGWRAMPVDPYPVTSLPSEVWAEEGQQARVWLTEARASLGAPALSAAVSVNGEIVWAGVAGYADIDRRVAATLNTAFRTGSSSKAVTSIAMATLISANAVDLDAPVGAYMPDLAEPLARVTTRQAMGHQAGVRDYGLCLCFPIAEYFNRKHYETQRDALRPYERSPLLFEPAHGFSYSSFGYNVAGGVIEAVSGRRFSDFLNEAVFVPLSMRSTRADSGRPQEADATFYDTSRPGLYAETFRVDNTNKLPSGGILSTPSDMTRLGHQMIEPTLFDAATRDLLMAPQSLADGSLTSYGLGWRYQSGTEIFDGAETTPRLHHHGTAYGATSHFTVYPEYRMVVSVMMNTEQSSGQRLGSWADTLAEIFAARPGIKAAEFFAER